MTTKKFFTALENVDFYIFGCAILSLLSAYSIYGSCISSGQGVVYCIIMAVFFGIGALILSVVTVIDFRQELKRIDDEEERKAREAAWWADQLRKRDEDIRRMNEKIYNA